MVDVLHVLSTGSLLDLDPGVVVTGLADRAAARLCRGWIDAGKSKVLKEGQEEGEISKNAIEREDG